MGQGYKYINLDRKESFHPHDLNDGYKLIEQINAHGPNLLMYLVAKSEDSEGGDVDEKILDIPASKRMYGRWAGQRVMLVGDYDSSGLYEKAEGRGWKSISKPLIAEWNKMLALAGWKEPQIKSR
jgi:hypothetical protein